MPTRPLLAALLGLALVVSACSDDGDDGASTTTTTTRMATSSTTSSTTTTLVPTSAPNEPCAVDGAAADTRTADGASLLLLDDVSVGTAGCAATVTFEFLDPSTGPATAPGYSIGYEEAPLRTEGAGTEVAVAGGAYLVLRLTPVSTANLSVDPIVITYDGPESITSATGPIREVRSLGSFEAQTTWAIGVDDRRPFAISATAAPQRLVVTIG